jgi:hypothetical protein
MISDELKLKFLLKLMQTENGWKKIAHTIKNSTSYSTKNELEKMLLDISGGVIVVISGSTTKLSDILLETFNYYLGEANKSDSLANLLSLTDEALLQTIPQIENK